MSDRIRVHFAIVVDVAMGEKELRYNGPSPLSPWDAWDITKTKWQIMKENPGILDGGSSTCGLCLFFTCSNCPIGRYTLRSGCHDTPYWEYHYAVHGPRSSEAYQRDCANRELAFLALVEEWWEGQVGQVDQTLESAQQQ